MFSVMVFVLILKTSFPRLVCNTFHHSRASFLDWLAIDVAGGKQKNRVPSSGPRIRLDPTGTDLDLVRPALKFKTRL